MGASAGSLESLRRLNRLRIVDVLKAAGSASRAEIARATGLSRSTVSTVVGELVAQGLIVEEGDGPGPAGGAAKLARARPRGESGQGRPPVMLSLNPSAGLAVGIDFSHDHIRVAISDLARTVLAHRIAEVDVDHGAAGSITVAVELTRAALRAAGRRGEEALGAGVALAAPIDPATSRIHPSAIMPGWIGVDVGGELSERLGIPVHVDNDANLGALAEVTLGAGRNARDAVYIQISSGVGAGVIVDGRPFRGASGTAGEIGHIIVEENGTLCRCGNRGCLETLASGPALVSRFRAGGGAGPGLTVAGLVALAGEGDEDARRAIAASGRAVGRAAATLCNLFNPEMIVVGGDVSAAGEVLLAPLREAIDRYALPAATERLAVVSGALGERANVLGAVALAIGHADTGLAGGPALAGAREQGGNS